MSRSPSAKIVTGAGVATSALLYIVLALGSLFVAPPGPLQALRTAFWHDQLGYLSIVADVASGDFRNTEPVTQTGVNHYPRSYYSLVGAVANVFHLEPVFAWNAVSVAFQLVALGALAFAMARVSGRPWMSFLAPLPFFAGVMAFVRDGGWFRSLDSHAVLWGPYGVMFSNNGETAGLSVVTASLSILAVVWLRPTRRAVRITLTIVSAASLGLLSGFQTYSFLSGAYVVAYLLAARFLLHERRRWWIVATVVALLAVVLLGPAVSARAGQLPTLVFGLFPAVPGLVRGLIRSRGALALYVAVYAAAALPQIAWTMSGVLAGDPFLTYRVASNVDLGVLKVGSLVASMAVALPLLVIAITGWLRRRRDAAAFATAMLVTWPVLALNDLWGANAEPYRFWIDMFLIGGVVAALSAARLYAREGIDHPDAPPSTSSHPAAGRYVQAVAWSLVAVVYIVSLGDYVAFRRDPAMSATWNPAVSREVAIADLGQAAAAEDDALILTDPCIDPRTAKVTSAAPLAFYYLGMAWPLDRDAVQDVMSARDAASVDALAMTEGDVGWILVDSNCDRLLDVAQASIEVVDERSYDNGSGTISLLRYRGS